MHQQQAMASASSSSSSNNVSTLPPVPEYGQTYGHSANLTPNAYRVEPSMIEDAHDEGPSPNEDGDRDGNGDRDEDEDERFDDAYFHKKFSYYMNEGLTNDA